MILSACGGGGGGGGNTAQVGQIATTAADTFTGSTQQVNDYVSYEDSDAGVVINLADGTGSGGYATGDRFISIEHVIGSDYSDIITGDANVNDLDGLAGDDILNGGAGNDILWGDFGDDIFVLGNKTQGEDHVIDFSSRTDVSYQLGHDKIRIVTDTGSETTLNALYAAANIRVDNTQNYSGDFDTYDNNSSSINDTQIYHTNGTANDTSDDILLMVLEDFTDPLTINDFLIVDKDDVIPTTILALDAKATAAADTFTGQDSPYFDDAVSYEDSDVGVTINLATNTASGGYAQGDSFTSIEGITGSRYNDIITGDVHDNRLHGLAGNDILTGGAGDDIFALGDKMQGENHVTDFVHDASQSDRISIDLTGTEREYHLSSNNGSGTIFVGDTTDPTYRFDNTQNYSGSFDSNSNDANTNDTQIYHTNGTNTTSDDILLIVLEDYTDLTTDMFEII